MTSTEISRVVPTAVVPRVRPEPASAPDPSALLMGADPIPAVATPDQRALLEWAQANPIASPHPGMTKDGSRYSAPGPGESKAKARTRVTTYAEALDDGEGLIRWRHRLLTEGLATLPDALAVAYSHDDPEHRKQAIDRLIGKALHHAGEKLAADVGTALHLAAEHHVTGSGIRPPAPWDADVDAFAAMLAAHQLDVRLSEAVLWVPIGDGLCGTADLLVAGPWGDELRVVDLKTGSSAQRIGYACQLACYTAATHRWTEAGWEPLPAIDGGTAYIAHLPAGSGACELVAVSLDDRLVELAGEVRERRKQRNVAAMFAAVEAPPSLFDAAPADAPATTDAEWITDADPDAMRAWMLGRVRAVAAGGGESAATLSRHWPEGVSPSDPASWDGAALVALHEALVHIEAAAGIQPDFPPTNPIPVEMGVEIPVRNDPSNWIVEDHGGPIDADLSLAVSGGFATLDDERKALAGSWAKDGKLGERHWAVGADSLTPRLLAVYAAVLSCLRNLWDSDGAPDCDRTTRAALSLVIGEDVQPAWRTGAIFGAITIDQAQRLDEMAVAFTVDGFTAGEVGAKALALSA
jgi:hypothetical protein